MSRPTDGRPTDAYAAARAMLGAAARDGVSVVGGDGLRATGPGEAVRRWIRVLRPHRDAVEAIVEARDERAAIMEYDGGLSRIDAAAARIAMGVSE